MVKGLYGRHLTESISLDFGGRILALDKHEGTPDTTSHVCNNVAGGGPPEKWVAHQVDVVIGLLAAVVVQSAFHKWP